MRSPFFNYQDAIAFKARKSFCILTRGRFGLSIRKSVMLMFFLIEGDRQLFIFKSLQSKRFRLFLTLI